MTSPRVLRIVRIGLTVADLPAMQAFYTGGLGFEQAATETLEGPAFVALTGIDDPQARATLLRLGEVEVELVAFDSPGRPYPWPRASNDPWLQHFAVSVSDMPTGYAAVSRQGPAAISEGGPVALPPSTGSVMAWKFRDPEGRPLELSYNPAETQAPRAGSPFLRVDHSAIAVADLAVSVAFYTDLLGMRAETRLLNVGPTQARLDGLPDPEVDIVVVTPDPADQGSGGGPHLELLHYRRPVSSAAPIELRPDDLAATRLVMKVDDLAGLTSRLRVAGTRFVSRDSASAALIRDPDGHLLQLVQR